MDLKKFPSYEGKTDQRWVFSQNRVWKKAKNFLIIKSKVLIPRKEVNGNQPD